MRTVKTDDSKAVPITISGISLIDGNISDQKIDEKCSKIFFYCEERGIFFIAVGRGKGRGTPFGVKKVIQISDDNSLGDFTLIKNNKSCRFSNLVFGRWNLRIFPDKEIVYEEKIEMKFYKLIKIAVDAFIERKEAKSPVVKNRKKGGNKL